MDNAPPENERLECSLAGTHKLISASLLVTRRRQKRKRGRGGRNFRQGLSKKWVLSALPLLAARTNHHATPATATSKLQNNRFSSRTPCKGRCASAGRCWSKLDSSQQSSPVAFYIALGRVGPHLTIPEVSPNGRRCCHNWRSCGIS